MSCGFDTIYKRQKLNLSRKEQEQMKSFLLTLLTILIVGVVTVGGYFGVQWFKNREAFMWGVNIRPHAVGDWNIKNWGKQMDLATALGVNGARVTWQHDGYYKGREDPFAFNDALYDSLIDNGIKMVLVIEPDPRGGITDYYQTGYDDGKSIASHYKGKIKYYQMINEGGAQSIKSSTANGQEASQYDEAKYIIVRDYIKGLSAGITKGDRSAKKIVSISWTHTGYLDKLVQDGIKFDWIGLDWYDWMGSIEEKKMDNGTLFVDKLKSYKKPLVFMEANAVPNKTVVNEAKQTEFISKTAEWAWANKSLVKGFFVLELVDNVNNNSANAESFGIVAASRNGRTKFDVDAPRPAYAAYQAIIKKYSK